MTKEIAMGSMILFLLLAPLSMAAFAAEEKRVCVKELDNKTKKEREVCKTIKVHKKLEGIRIEDAKKDEKKK
jgi:hypothetical protein